MKILRFVLLGALIGGLLIGFQETRGPADSKETERFVINLKETESETVDRLIKEGYLKNKTLFNLFLDFKGWHGKLTPGSYLIAKNMNLFELARTLVERPYQRWVLVPPGKRKEQVALILQKSLSWPNEKSRQFIEVAQEGYLYPDTYLIAAEATPEEVFQKFLNNFNEKFDLPLQRELLAQNIKNDTALKIASLIERESGGDFDKPIIAAVIWNRLLKGMRLEIDATVQYAITTKQLLAQNYQVSGDFEFWAKLPPGTVKKIESLYNTYLNDGLPPGPICSPSIASLKAVANSSETKALYYLHSPDKQIHTALTYKEHQENIEKYLK